MSSNHAGGGVFTGWWGTKFENFKIFLSLDGKKQLVFQFNWLNLYLNGQI
jgi:hypothetical protein